MIGILIIATKINNETRIILRLRNNGFMYLTETFTILKKKNFKISEQATIFINRKKGSSSLRLSEILRSFLGIIKLKLKRL